MRILYVVNTLALEGGMQIVTRLKLNALAETDGVEAAIAYLQPEDDRCRQLPLSPKVTLFDIAGAMPWGVRRNLKRVIRDWRPDIVVSIGTIEKYIIPTLFGRVGRHRFKTLREFHFASNFRNTPGYGFRLGRIVTWLDKHVITRLFDANFLLTEEDLEANFAGHSRRMSVMPNPLTLPLPESVTPIEERPLRVVTVGRLVDQKNPQDAIRVWKSACEEGWTFRMIGEGTLRKELEALRDSLGLHGSVELPGWSSDVAGELEESRILLLTSRYEGFGLVIIEAMAHGVVPVSYASPYGPRDIITDGVDGFLVEPGDVEGMAARVRQLMADPILLQRMSEAAFRRAHDFALDKTITRWLGHYRSLTPNPSPLIMTNSSCTNHSSSAS